MHDLFLEGLEDVELLTVGIEVFRLPGTPWFIPLRLYRDFVDRVEVLEGHTSGASPNEGQNDRIGPHPTHTTFNLVIERTKGETLRMFSENTAGARIEVPIPSSGHRSRFWASVLCPLLTNFPSSGFCFEIVPSTIK